MIYNDTYGKNWLSYAILAWLKSQIKEAPHMERVEFCMQYSGRFIEDKWLNDDGEAEYHAGLKTRVFREMAVRVWAVPLVKEVGFVFRDQDGKGDTYQYVQREVNGWDLGPRGYGDGDWTVGKRRWLD